MGNDDKALADYTSRLIVLSIQAQSVLGAKVKAILDESLRFQTRPDLSDEDAQMARDAARKIVARISVADAVAEWWAEHPELATERTKHEAFMNLGKAARDYLTEAGAALKDKPDV